MKVIGRAPLAANVAAAVVTAQLFPQVQNPAAAASLYLTGDGKFVGKQFSIRATGQAKTNNATTTVTTSLYAVVGADPANPLVAGSWTLLGASTARVQNLTTAPWTIEAILCYDTLLGKLHGSRMHIVNNALDAHAALAGVIAGLVDASSANAGLPVATFVVGVTFGTNADVLNVATLSEFVIGF